MDKSVPLTRWCPRCRERVCVNVAVPAWFQELRALLCASCGALLDITSRQQRRRARKRGSPPLPSTLRPRIIPQTENGNVG